MRESAANPYVGPRSFEEKDFDYFFGRQDEIARLQALAVSRRAVLLYSPSGVGKSSLLKAGLLPGLRGIPGAACFPVARVGGDPVQGLAPANLFVFHLLTYLLGESTALEEIAALSLADGLRRALGSLGGESPEVAFLAIDQFEEVFSAGRLRPGDLEDFFLQLQQALRVHPELTLLLALREDWLAHLDPYLDRFPDRLRARFRLELLGRRAALDAIVRPAQKAGVLIRPEAAGLLVDDLLKSRIQTPEGEVVELPGTHVDPVQLQIVCHRLWALHRPEGPTDIGVPQVRATGSASQALADYYAERVEEAARTAGVPERAIRDWCEHELITPQHIRGQVLADQGCTRGLDNRVVRALVDAHLLRPEPRRGAVWYELAHDRLIEPVVRNNREWRQKNTTPLERQALLWQESGRPPAKLLKGRALRKALKGGGAEVSPAAQEFLVRCLERRAGTHRSWIALVLALALIVAILLNFLRAPALASWAGSSTLSRVQADLGEMAHHDAGRALFLALACQQLEKRLYKWTFWGAFRRELPDPHRMLFEVLAANPSLAELRSTAGVRTALRPLPLGDGRSLVEGRRDGTFLLRDAATGAPRSAPVDGEVGAITALAVAPGGRRLAVGGAGGAVRLWDLAALRPAGGPFQAVGEEVVALSFQEDGETLLAVHPRTTAVWKPRAEPAFGKKVGAFPPGASGVRSVPGGALAVRSPADPDLLATASAEGIFLWDLGVQPRRLAAGPFRGHRGGIVALAFDRAGRLYSEGTEGTIFQWDVSFRSWEQKARRIIARQPHGCDELLRYFPQNRFTQPLLIKTVQYPEEICPP